MLTMVVNRSTPLDIRDRTIITEEIDKIMANSQMHVTSAMNKIDQKGKITTVKLQITIIMGLNIVKQEVRMITTTATTIITGKYPKERAFEGSRSYRSLVGPLKWNCKTSIDFNKT